MIIKTFTALFYESSFHIDSNMFPVLSWPGFHLRAYFLMKVVLKFTEQTPQIAPGRITVCCTSLELFEAFQSNKVKIGETSS